MGRHIGGAWLRCFVGLVFVLAALPGATASSAADSGPRLYVYLPSTVRPPMLQKLLNDALPGTTVMVFRHLRDFETNVAESPPDFVISARPFLDQHDGWTPILQGFAGDRADEAYVLVSLSQTADSAPEASAVVGVVDLLGKKAMPALVARFVGASAPLKVTRVAQPEDLLPLLELGLANAVLMPARAVAALREKSTLNLREVELKDARMGLPSLAVVSKRSPAGDMERKLMSRLMSLSAKLQAMLGVDEWRRP
jgi:hypothetical protein